MSSNSSKPRVLLVCPFFPPAHMSGAHRARHFSLHLSELGWDPVVLTAPTERYERDLEWPLFEQLPKELEIERVWTVPERPLRIGDLSVRVLPGMLWRAISLCRGEKIDAVFCTGGPWFTFIVGYLLKHLFGIPYILDYQDPWIYEPSGWKPPRFLSRDGLMIAVMKRLEPIVLKRADLVMAVSGGTHEILLERYPWLDTSKFSVVPIGVELSDFSLAERLSPPLNLLSQEEGATNVVYTGAVWYGAWPVVESLLAAIGRLRSENDELLSKCTFNFIGTGWHKDESKNAWTSKLAKKLDIADLVSETVKSEPYLSAISYMGAADVLILIGSPERYYMASKLFQYIYTGKPILAVLFDQSPMIPALEASGRAVIVTYSQPSELSGMIDEITEALATILMNPEPRSSNSEELFTGLSSTRLLVKHLNELTSAG